MNVNTLLKLVGYVVALILLFAIFRLLWVPAALCSTPVFVIVHTLNCLVFWPALVRSEPVGDYKGGMESALILLVAHIIAVTIFLRYDLCRSRHKMGLGKLVGIVSIRVVIAVVAMNIVRLSLGWEVNIIWP